MARTGTSRFLIDLFTGKITDDISGEARERTHGLVNFHVPALQDMIKEQIGPSLGTHAYFKGGPGGITSEVGRLRFNSNFLGKFMGKFKGAGEKLGRVGELAGKVGEVAERAGIREAGGLLRGAGRVVGTGLEAAEKAVGWAESFGKAIPGIEAFGIGGGLAGAMGVLKGDTGPKSKQAMGFRADRSRNLEKDPLFEGEMLATKNASTGDYIRDREPQQRTGPWLRGLGKGFRGMFGGNQ